jgi:predicted CoA-substrate-specific enzyme activase
MSEPTELWAGVDVGSSAIKVALLERGGALVHCFLRETTLRLDESLDAVERELEAFCAGGHRLAGLVSTGYGRRRLAGRGAAKPEIICHGRGVYHQLRRACTVVDIGGQDNKVIQLDASGAVDGFRMNTKCAAGTGAFLEEIAAKARLPLAGLNALAGASCSETAINSFCTVFAMTEVLQRIIAGEKLEDIVRGVFISVAERVRELAPAHEAPLVLTGGVVAHNPVLAELVSQRLGREALVCDNPRYTGAVGAALLAMDGAAREG